MSAGERRRRRGSEAAARARTVGGYEMKNVFIIDAKLGLKRKKKRDY